LLDADFVGRLGPKEPEILCGNRPAAQADWAASALRGVHYFDLTWNNWRAAARLGRQLAARGHQLPRSDLALAAFASDREYAVWTSDPHFDLIPDLKRYQAN
jgi:predicted nucleic acid-binding protein